MLTINHLTVAYDETPVLSDVTVSFASGKITGIIGPNGAGKSTLIKAALGLINKTSGDATFDGRSLAQQRQRVAYVEQRKDLDLSFPINVFDVVMSGTYGRLGLFRSPGKPARAATDAALAEVDLTAFAARQIGQLSGGQLQRVFVARAIVQQAALIILDEPFVGIDLQSETAIMAILRRWRDEGKTVIVVHHDLNKVTHYFDELVVMNHGIIAAGPVGETFTAANIAKAFSRDLSAVLFDQAMEVGE